MTEYKGFLIEECDGYYRIWLVHDIIRICKTESEAKSLIDNHAV